MGTKLSQLTEAIDFSNTDIMHLRTVGGIDKKITGLNIVNGFQDILSKSANYTIIDTDRHPIILMTTSTTDKTVTLPTLADNLGKRIRLIKMDSGVGKAILDGEGAETINGTLTWEVMEQWGYVDVIGTSTTWLVIDQWGCIYEEKSNTTASQVHPPVGIWHNLGLFRLLHVPAGIYMVEYSVAARAFKQTTTTNMDIYCTLASNGAAETDKDFTAVGQLKGYGAYDHPEIVHTFFRRKKVVLANVQSFYLNTLTYEPNTIYIYNANGGSTAIIRATRIA